jgi:hypothetical protein
MKYFNTPFIGAAVQSMYRLEASQTARDDLMPPQETADFYAAYQGAQPWGHPSDPPLESSP